MDTILFKIFRLFNYFISKFVRLVQLIFIVGSFKQMDFIKVFIYTMS